VHGPREVLNELKWRHEALDEAVVYYVHRGAPDDTGIVTGDRIRELHHSWIEIPGPESNTMIPYHRVLRIDRGAQTIWTRRAQHE
jgi:uncharacterized protein (UPF0248 family)